MDKLQEVYFKEKKAVLTDWKGLSANDIADITGLSVEEIEAL